MGWIHWKYPIRVVVFGLLMGRALADEGLAIAIGLNAVDETAYRGWKGELVACENDAHAMASVAAAQGFTTIELLTAKASKAAVVKSIEDASNRLRKGDILVLSYSGHGGQIPDLNGDENDGLDETWCLYDGELLDDELAVLWSKFADGVRIVIYSDSCHSGTIIKNFDPQKKQALQGVRIKAIPEEIQKKFLEIPENKTLGLAIPSEKNSKSETKASVILISGCGDDQYSIDGEVNSYFTDKLIKVWAGGGFSGGYHDFHEAIKAKMPDDQVPQFDSYGRDDPAFEAQKPWAK